MIIILGELLGISFIRVLLLTFILLNNYLLFLGLIQLKPGLGRLLACQNFLFIIIKILVLLVQTVTILRVSSKDSFKQDYQQMLGFRFVVLDHACY